MKTRTFNLKVSTIELKEKLLSHFKTNPFFDTLAEIIIDSIDNENNLARLYSYVAGIAEPISMEEVAKNNAKHPTVTWKLKYPLQSINEESILAQVGDMEHLDLIVEDGRVFTRVDVDENVVAIKEHIQEQKGFYEGRKDYLGRSIVYHIPGGKYEVLSFK